MRRSEKQIYVPEKMIAMLSMLVANGALAAIAITLLYKMGLVHLPLAILLKYAAAILGPFMIMALALAICFGVPTLRPSAVTTMILAPTITLIIFAVATPLTIHQIAGSAVLPMSPLLIAAIVFAVIAMALFITTVLLLINSPDGANWIMLLYLLPSVVSAAIEMILSFIYTIHLMTSISGSALTFPLLGIVSSVLALGLGIGLIIHALRNPIKISTQMAGLMPHKDEGITINAHHHSVPSPRPSAHASYSHRQ
jgi:hypothetical protein